jgi:dynein heavy chain
LRFKDTQTEKKEEEISDDPEMVYKREVKNLYETQLELFPSKREFLSKI